MYEKIVILFCAVTAAFGHGIEVTTPFPVTTALPVQTSGPVITSYSSPAPSETVSNTYLPVPSAAPEVKIGSNYHRFSNTHSGSSSYVPLHSSHSVYNPASVNSYGQSYNVFSTTQATPTYTTSAPAYSTFPTFQSRSSFGKSYPSVASYVKSTIAPSYSYSLSSKPIGHGASYPSVNTYVHPVAKSSFSHYSYNQPHSYYQSTPAPYYVSQAGYSPYQSQSVAYYPSSTPAPTVVSSTLGYDSSSPLAYSVSPTVATYSTPSSYSIQAAPLRAHLSYSVPQSYSANGYGGQVIQNVGLPYYGSPTAVPLVAESHYPSYSAGHGSAFSYNSVPVSHGNSVNYGW